MMMREREKEQGYINLQRGLCLLLGRTLGNLVTEVPCSNPTPVGSSLIGLA